MVGGVGGGDGRERAPWVDRSGGALWDRLPGAVKLVSVPLETVPEQRDVASQSPTSVNDHSGPCRLPLHAGSEPPYLVLVPINGDVEAGRFRSNVSLPSPAGVGHTLGPGFGLFGASTAVPPTRTMLSVPLRRRAGEPRRYGGRTRPGWLRSRDKPLGRPRGQPVPVRPGAESPWRRPACARSRELPPERRCLH